jgi:hypothetical protein
MKNIFIGLIILLLNNLVCGQTNIPVLQEFSAKSSEISKNEQIRANRLADLQGMPKRIERGNTVIELAGFAKGIPLYRTTNNLNAAATTSTSAVWSGGGAGLNLTGSGVTLGIWDGGPVRTTHQEYGWRVVVKDGSTATAAHATHVGGTMIASGVVPTAKGMSPAANLWSSDWNTDISEMALRAAEGLQVSNHSYGFIAGWSKNTLGDSRWVWYGYEPYSTTTAYGFGAYESISHDWDFVAFSAPDYLIVKSSGNDRGEGPASQPVEHWVYDYTLDSWVLSTAVRDKDGGIYGFDCISYQGVAKNILTVGSVNDITTGYQQPSDVVLASSSSTGPADDGRIKPDIVANGVDLYSSSSSSDDSYSRMSGTSMATPNVSGSAGLLIEHHFNLTGSSSIRSATLKGLIIHTADEAGTNPGPDYKFGWGLLNTQKAALLMSEDASNGQNFNIRELALSQGEIILIPVYTKGTEPLTATICWTDPPSTVYGQYVNDPTPMLVNDLDIRLIGDSEETFLPWKLDGVNPSAAATTADNMVDNIEKVEAGTPSAQRTYILQITHKGTLINGLQNFSLIVSGITPAPEVTEWNGAVDSDWHTPGNWNWGVPGAETDVTIASTSANIATINTTAWCNDLTIDTEGALTLNPGKTLNVKGNMLIQSSATTTGSYIGSSPVVSGTSGMERHINAYTNQFNGWHLISSPVAAQPIGDFYSLNSGNDFYKWDEISGLWINRITSGGVLNESFEDNFAIGRGYLIANSDISTKLFSGAFNDETVSLSGLSRNENNDSPGWNLIGNPFPSALAWNDGVNWSVPVNFAGIAKVWDESSSSYTDVGAGEPIPSGNGFMVQVLTGSPATLTIPLEARVHHGQNWFKSSQTRLVLTASDTEHATSQKTVVAIQQGSTENFDNEFDSRFLPGSAPVFYSVSGNDLLSTNTMPGVPLGKFIQLGFIKNDAVNFRLNLSDINLPVDTRVFLIDEKEGKIQDLQLESRYDFTSFDGDDPFRFKLYFTGQVENPEEQFDDFIAYSVNNNLVIVTGSEKNCTISLINAAGKQLLQSQTDGKNIFSVDVGNYPHGLYIVSLIKGNKTLNKKIIL